MMRCVARLPKLLDAPRCRSLSTYKALMKASDLIPTKPTWEHTSEAELPPPTKVSLELAKRLERLSLVNFEDTKAVERLESAIRFADQIRLVDTEGIAPMVTVLEDIELPLRNDDVIETDPDIVSLAQQTFEGYYISPMGNITYDGDNIPDSS